MSIRISMNKVLIFEAHWDVKGIIVPVMEGSLYGFKSQPGASWLMAKPTSIVYI